MKSGWVTKKLGEVCETITDGDHQPPPKVASGVPFLVISDLSKGRLSFEDTRFVPEEYYAKIPEAKKPQIGDVLLTVTGSFGIPVLVDTEKSFCFQRHIALLRPNQMISRFLVYQLSSHESFKYFDKVATGTAQRTVSLSSLRNMEIVAPPLAEQKRIVAKIDAAFEKIDKLKANAEKNLANAKELFQSALDEAMRPKKGWVEKRLGKVANVRVGPFGSSLHKADYVDAGVPLVNPCHMKSSRIAEDISTQVSHEKANELNDYRLSTGDIVFARRGEIGRLAFVSERENGYLCGTGSLFARFIEKFDIRFLYYSFSSPEFVRRLEKLSTGTTMKSINSSALESMVFFSPPIAEQQRISKRLDLLSQKLETLQQNYARQVADCAEMRQAILREAFEGRLCMREKDIPLALTEQDTPAPRKIGVAQGKWQFPEDWEALDKALDAEIAEDFYAD